MGSVFVFLDLHWININIRSYLLIYITDPYKPMFTYMSLYTPHSILWLRYQFALVIRFAIKRKTQSVRSHNYTYRICIKSFDRSNSTPLGICFCFDIWFVFIVYLLCLHFISAESSETDYGGSEATEEIQCQIILTNRYSCFKKT